MYRNATEVENDLAQPYSGPTREKDGKTYIPAFESRKALDRLFGPLGWSESSPVVTIDPQHGVYGAAVQITGYVVDDNGEVRPVSRIGFGRSIAQATKDERDQGLTVTKNLQTHDTAVAAAGTDAFSRACKMFGPALGSELYAGTPTQSSTPRPSSTGKGPSDKQRAILNKDGFTDDQIDAMPFATWKGHLDAHFAGAKKTEEVPF